LLGWSKAYTTNPLALQINHHSHNATYHEITVRRKALPLVTHAFANVGNIVGGNYRIAHLIFDWGTWTAGLKFSNPAISPVFGWEMHSGTDTLNAPWAIRSGNRIIVYYNSNPTPGSQIGAIYSDNDGATWTRASGNPLFPSDGIIGSPNRFGTHFACVWKSTNKWYAITSGWSGNNPSTSECYMILWEANDPLGLGLKRRFLVEAIVRY